MQLYYQLLYILKHHRKTRQIKRKRKQQVVIGTRKLSVFYYNVLFYDVVEFDEIGIFLSSALEIADLVSLCNSFRWSVIFSCLFSPLEGSFSVNTFQAFIGYSHYQILTVFVNKYQDVYHQEEESFWVARSDNESSQMKEYTVGYDDGYATV